MLQDIILPSEKLKIIMALVIIIITTEGFKKQKLILKNKGTEMGFFR